jgi:hypothetical protein
MEIGSMRLRVILVALGLFFINLITVVSLPLFANEISSNGDFEINWVDNWMEDDPNLIANDEDIAFNYDDIQNSLYYLGDESVYVQLTMINDGVNDFYDLYITLAAIDPIIIGIPDNRWPATGDYGDTPPGEVFSPGERIDSDPSGAGGTLPIFTIDIESIGEVNTLYQDALQITISYVEDIGGGTPRTDTFSFDIYISSLFDDNSPTSEIDIHDDLPNIEETDAHPEFEPGYNMQEGEIILRNHADFSISEVEAVLSNLPTGISFSGGNDTAFHSVVTANGGVLDLYWNFDVDFSIIPFYYTFDLQIKYNRSDKGKIITENIRTTGLYIATSSFVTGPIGGPTNVADITITYDMTGSPLSVDLYYTTNTSIPYSWTFINTDSTPDGSYGWTVPVDGLYGWIAVSDNETAPNSSSSPESSFYIYDGTPPIIEYSDPIHNTVDVAINRDIIITFNESMNTNSVSYSVEPDPGGLSSNWGGGNKILTITHSDFLSYTKYWVNITAGKDIAGNNLSSLPFSFYFYSVYIPNTATVFAPISASINIPQISILYSTTEDPLNVQLYYTTNSDYPFIWTLIGEDSPGDGSYDWTLPGDGHYGWYAVSPDELAPNSGDSPEAMYYNYDGTRPEILNTVPENLATDISLNQYIEIEFSEPMNTGAVENAFSYTDGQTVWDINQGTVTWNSNIDKMTFTPSLVLGYNMNYTVTIENNAKDLANNTLETDHSWSFKTILPPDTIAPTISTVSPIGDNTEITNTIIIIFTEEMNHTRVEESIIISGETQINTFQWMGTMCTITLFEDTEYSTQYTVSIGTGATDIAGNALSEPYIWTFTTKKPPDAIPPTISTVSPIGENAEVTSTIIILFSEAMNRTRVEESITISGDTQVNNYSWVGTTLTITLSEELKHRTQYTVSIGTAASDEAGNTLSDPYTWTFTTKEKKEEPTSEISLGLIILLIVMAVFIVLILVMKKGKPKSESELKESLGEEPEIPKESQENENEKK